jgi:hypothetical protein
MLISSHKIAKESCGRNENVQTASEFGNLPPYIKRHLSTRYGLWREGDGWPSPDGQDEYIRLVLQDRQQNGLKYLALTIRDIHYASHSTPELIQILADLPTDGTGPVVVSELIRRLDGLDENAKVQLSETLRQITADPQQQASKRTVADRAVMRLLYRMNFQQAFSTALVCAISPRAIRREASYRFYLANGIDETGREVLATTIWETSIRYRRVIATDQLLVLKLSLARVLELAPSTYWRMVAIGKVLDPGDYTDVIAICADYPLELIWAIHEGRLVYLVPQILQMLEQYKGDAYLLNRIVQCLARLGDADGITLAVERATDLLSREAIRPVSTS